MAAETERAREPVRQQVAFYASTPADRDVLARCGLADVADRVMIYQPYQRRAKLYTGLTVKSYDSLGPWIESCP